MTQRKAVDRILGRVAEATYKHRWYTIALSLAQGGLNLYLDQTYGLTLANFIHWKLYLLQAWLCGC